MLLITDGISLGLTGLLYKGDLTLSKWFQFVIDLFLAVTLVLLTRISKIQEDAMKSVAVGDE